LEPDITNIRVIDPTTHPCPLHAYPPPCALPPPRSLCSALLPPTPPLQRTHRHYLQQHHPPSYLLPRVTCSIIATPHPSTATYLQNPLAAPSTLISLKAKHTPDKIPSTKLQATSYSTRGFWSRRSTSTYRGGGATRMTCGNCRGELDLDRR
jgi:hypothetical protein